MSMEQGIRWFICVTACLLIAGGGLADDNHSILGTVTTDTGKALAGVTIDFGDNLASVLTDTAGYYEAAGAVEGGVYLVEPAAAGWTFSPTRRAVVMGSGDEQVNFSAEPVGGQFAGMLFAPPTASSAEAKYNPLIPSVTYPAGGETWTQGQSYNIRWSHTSIPASSPMSIRLQKNGVNHTVVANGTPNDGSFWWKVPGSVQAGTDYSIRIADTLFHAGTGGQFTVEAAPLVTYPNDDGICWRRGQGYQIKWQGFPGANVKLQLYRGSLLSRGVAWSTPNDGSFWWTVPDDQTTDDNYKIKVTARSDTSVSDASDRPFTIVNNPRVTYPTEPGIVWDVGGSYTITWRQFVADQVKIDLIRCNLLDRTISATTANDGSFSWQVPYDLDTGSAFQIRVRAVGCAAQSDKSNNDFEIRRVPAVTYPTANGITWNAGSPYGITWHGFTSTNVKIELLKGWALDRVIVDSTPNTGLYQWFWAPMFQTPGTNYRVRVTATSGPAQQDVSDRNFTIARAPMVTYPTQLGVQWAYGESVPIQWQGFEGDEVKIELLQWGALKRTITWHAANDGMFWWKVHPRTHFTAGIGFKIRVTDASDPTVSGQSNQYFRINARPVVLNPNGPEWLHGPNYEIRWSDFGATSVRIELWDGGSLDHVIADSTPNDGSYDWHISGTAGEEWRIRVRGLSGPHQADFSDRYFKMGPADKREEE